MFSKMMRMAIGVIAVAVMVAGCAGDTDDAGPTTSQAATTTSFPATTTTSIAPFDGPGDFYDVPDPLPSGEPGSLIRFQPVDGSTATDRSLWRVMYHSRDAADRDVAVTGLVSVPTAPAPSGGWPTMSWGHGTSGMAPACAPSRKQKGVPTFGTTGIVAASDYIGLGPNGQRHAFLSGASEGHSVIDVVRAARQLPDVEASKEWTAVGISQGGHAILFATELAGAYAPELTLLGSVGMAPATELDRDMPGDVAPLVTVIRTMAIYGSAVDHPDFHPEQYATPELQAASGQLDAVCIDAIGPVLATIPADKFWTTDPLTTDVGRRIAAENNPVRSVVPTPLLVVQGDADIVVVPARTDAFVDRLCSMGQDLQFESVPGADHNLKSDQAQAIVTAWLAARLAHEPSAPNCP